MDREKDLIERLSAQIVDWEAQMDRLQFQAESASEQRKGAYLEQLEALQQKRDEAQAQLQQIGTGESDVGKDLAEGTRDLGQDVKSDLRRAILKVK
jgi:SMC interacting uncharacterized protein involved in chromosome segregation